MPSKKPDFEKSATKKGFIENTKGDHIFYTFTDSEGKLYGKIKTRVSHGAKGGDIPDSILPAMKKQLQFDRKEDFDKFIECTFSEEEYRNLLRNKGYSV